MNRFSGESAEQQGQARNLRVAGSHNEALGMTLLRGRAIERGDIKRAEANVMRHKAFADAFFPGQDPIGFPRKTR